MLDIAADVASLTLTGEAEQQALAGGQTFANQVGTAEWLGPLAPVALSPFFGLCMLSGMATYGPPWLREGNSLLHSSELLRSPWLFWTMCVLAIVTSLPRFTKVSKPLALAAENLEAYSAVIILFAVRMLGGQPEFEDALAAGSADPMLAAGLVGWSTSLCMALFAALNVIVINAVKLFFEFLVWLIPFPAIDAALELANKGLCIGLMGIYTFSPVLATMLNLTILVICALVFGWTQRRLRFYQSIVLGPLLAWLFPRWFRQQGEWLTVACDSPMHGLPRYSRLQMRISGRHRVHLRGRWLWRTLDVELEPCDFVVEQQLIAQRLVVHHAGQRYATLLHRRWVESDGCYQWHPWQSTRLSTEQLAAREIST